MIRFRIGAGILAASLSAVILAASPSLGVPDNEKPEPLPDPFRLDPSLSLALEDIRDAREVLTIAESAEEAAWTLARTLEVPMLIANAKAEIMQEDIDDYARKIYMQGPDPSTLDIVLESEAETIEDLLAGVGEAQFVGGQKGTLNFEAQEDADAKEADYFSAVEAAVARRSITQEALMSLEQKQQDARDLGRSLGYQQFLAVLAPSSLGKDGCATMSNVDTVLPSVNSEILEICRTAVEGAETDEAKLAIKWAISRLGSPYACKGIGRENPFQYDCSSFVVAAYANGAGIDTRVDGWSPSTHAMLPNSNAGVFAPISSQELQPGDLVLYYTCPEGEKCPYNHVVMYLGEVNGQELMIHTNVCGGVSKIEPFWGAYDSSKGKYLGSRRVVDNGETVDALTKISDATDVSIEELEESGVDLELIL